MATFRLDPAPATAAVAPQPGAYEGLAADVLLENARWFTRIRWFAVGSLILLGAFGAFVAPGAARMLGVLPPGVWPWCVAAFLALLNLLDIAWIHRLSGATPRNRIAASIWFQIVSDLLVLTVLVYRIGPTETVVAFAYLFHIALACIFFTRRDSLIVLLLSVLLYTATVIALCLGWLPHRSILAPGVAGDFGVVSAALFALPAIAVWAVVWHLVSSISETVRHRDRELDAANRRLRQADAERNHQVLRVAHDLKAPFSGIETNIQILKHSYWEQTPDDVRSIIGKIEARSAALRARIGDILTLGNLRSGQAGPPAYEPVDLSRLLAEVVRDLQELAAQKRVIVALSTTPVTVMSNPEQLRILFANLLSNAVAYSQDGGRVEVSLAAGPPASVRITDHGIGIKRGALPHIFDDYYRAPDAVRFNPQSTGLGLAIVRHIAGQLGLGVAVESEPGVGSTFDVSIPPGRTGAGAPEPAHP
jgi:two-component system, OmpR family, phosphate regulon sensor histidine kinase PhoR